jgi:hypothetical protein
MALRTGRSRSVEGKRRSGHFATAGLGLTALALALAAPACTGRIEAGTTAHPRGGSAMPPDPEAAHDPARPPADQQPAVPEGGAEGPGRLRRLTRVQLVNSLRDLIGNVDLQETDPDQIRDGFASIGASYVAMSSSGVAKYESAILAALGPIFADPARRSALVGCAPDGAGGAGCVRNFITSFGRRAWRRPLTEAEIARYATLAATAAAARGNDLAAGLMHATSGLLASPYFLYRVEIGAPDPAHPGHYRYDAWEMASRLGYLLWNTTPDNELLAAAASGALDTRAGVQAQVARLLESPRAGEGIANFGGELLALGDFDDVTKDDPRFTASLRAAMIGEVGRMFARSLAPGADAMALFDTTSVEVDGELAKLYGITSVTGAAFAPATLPPAIPRAGLLGTAAFLTIHAKDHATSPTSRGKFVREAILCQGVADPPGDVNTNLPEIPEGTLLSKREQMEMHKNNPSCAPCHGFIDPIGYAYETFDWVGAYRTSDGGKPIDPSGDLDGQPFKDSRDLAGTLRRSPDVQSCLVKSFYRYVVGHLEGEPDAPAIGAWTAAFAKTEHRLADFLTDVIASDAFRAVSPPAP